MLRTLLIVSAAVIITALLLPVQMLLVLLQSQGVRRIPSLYHRIICTLLGVRIDLRGTITHQQPLLIVANHVSWLDIVIISAVAPVVFVAKSEVASWSFFGLLAKLQRSIFVDRSRRQRTSATTQEIARRLLAGDTVVLFAEGTSSDGHQVLPFRSALIGAAGEALLQSPGLTRIFVQPLSITYAGEQSQEIAWYGDMNLLPHIGRVLRTRKIEAVVSLGEPIAYTAQTERKALTKQLELRVRSLLADSADGLAVKRRNAPHPVQNVQGILG